MNSYLTLYTCLSKKEKGGTGDIPRNTKGKG